MPQVSTTVETSVLFRSLRSYSDRVSLRLHRIPAEFVPMFGGEIQPAGIGWYFKNFRVYCLDAYEDLTVDTLLREAMQRTGKIPSQVLDNLPITAVISELPYVDPKEPNMVYYLAKPEHLSQERWTKARAGRYLRRHCPSIDDETLKQYAANLRGEFTQYSLEFTAAGDADAVEYVYVKGPDSCMSGKGNHRQGEVRVDGAVFHPMRVMAHPDNNLRLAYMTNVEGNVLARVWTNCETMTYCRIYSKTDTYGNADEIFEAMLERAGYRNEDRETMWGEIIERIHTDCGAIVCPYIDPSNLGVELDDDHMVIGGSYEANYETGCLSDFDLEGAGKCNCDECGSSFHEEDLTYVEDNGRYVCTYCLDDEYTYAIIGRIRGSWHMDWVQNSRVVELAPGSNLPASYVYQEQVGDYFCMITAGRSAGYAADMDDCVYCEETDDCWYIEDLDLAGKAFCGDCNVVYDVDDRCPDCGDY